MTLGKLFLHSWIFTAGCGLNELLRIFCASLCIKPTKANSSQQFPILLHRLSLSHLLASPVRNKETDLRIDMDLVTSYDLELAFLPPPHFLQVPPKCESCNMGNQVLKFMNRLQRRKATLVHCTWATCCQGMYGKPHATYRCETAPAFKFSAPSAVNGRPYAQISRHLRLYSNRVHELYYLHFHPDSIKLLLCSLWFAHLQNHFLRRQGLPTAHFS